MRGTPWEPARPTEGGGAVDAGATAGGGLVNAAANVNYETSPLAAAIKSGGDDGFKQQVTVNIQTPNPGAFKASEHQIERDIARAAGRGARRSGR